MDQWKAAKGADVRASGWIGWFLGNAMVSLVWSFPLYLIGVAASERLTLAPNTGIEWAVWGGLAAILFVIARGKGRPDHLPAQRSDAQLRQAVSRGELSRDQAVAESMGFASRAEAEEWLRSEAADD